jgi:hypothetical protein
MTVYMPAEPSEPPPDGGGGAPAPGVIGTPIFNLTFNKHESGSLLKCMTYCNVACPDDIQLTAYLWVDGALAQYGQVNMTFSGATSNAKLPLTIPMFVSGIPAGAHTIQFTIRNSEASQQTLTILAGATIEITEVKRAAQ